MTSFNTVLIGWLVAVKCGTIFFEKCIPFQCIIISFVFRFFCTGLYLYTWIILLEYSKQLWIFLLRFITIVNNYGFFFIAAVLFVFAHLFYIALKIISIRLEPILVMCIWFFLYICLSILSLKPLLKYGLKHALYFYKKFRMV